MKKVITLLLLLVSVTSFAQDLEVTNAVTFDFSCNYLSLDEIREQYSAIASSTSDVSSGTIGPVEVEIDRIAREVTLKLQGCTDTVITLVGDPQEYLDGCNRLAIVNSIDDPSNLTQLQQELLEKNGITIRRVGRNYLFLYNNRIVSSSAIPGFFSVEEAESFFADNIAVVCSIERDFVDVTRSEINQIIDRIDIRQRGNCN